MTDVSTRHTARTLSPFLPSENPGRARVEAAVELLQLEISRLRVLQRADDRRAAAKRGASIEVDRITADATRKAEARQALRARSVCVDRSWFWSFANEILDEWRAEAIEARSHGQNGLVDQIQRRCDSLCTALETVQRDELLWTGKP